VIMSDPIMKNDNTVTNSSAIVNLPLMNLDVLFK
jgi:hypothetical protein